MFKVELRAILYFVPSILKQTLEMFLFFFAFYKTKNIELKSNEYPTISNVSS